jgi:hypothetical protein
MEKLKYKLMLLPKLCKTALDKPLPKAKIEIAKA